MKKKKKFQKVDKTILSQPEGLALSIGKAVAVPTIGPVIRNFRVKVEWLCNGFIINLPGSLCMPQLIYCFKKVTSQAFSVFAQKR